jgi:hypothetical protein
MRGFLRDALPRAAAMAVTFGFAATDDGRSA